MDIRVVQVGHAVNATGENRRMGGIVKAPV